MAAKEKISLLDVVPFRCENVITEKEGDCVVIAFPRFKYGWMRHLLLPGKSPMIRVKLEVHGTAVWEMIDGKRTVGDIIEKLAVHFNYETNYESRITTYICQLQKDKFIKLAINAPLPGLL